MKLNPNLNNNNNKIRKNSKQGNLITINMEDKIINNNKDKIIKVKEINNNKI